MKSGTKTEARRPKRNVINWLAWPALSFSRVVAGPPMTERERLNAAIAESGVRAYNGLYK